MERPTQRRKASTEYSDTCFDRGPHVHVQEAERNVVVIHPKHLRDAYNRCYANAESKTLRQPCIEHSEYQQKIYGTYNAPMRNIPVKLTFWAFVVFKVQTIGIGRARIMMSVNRVKSPLEVVIPMRFTQVACRFGSQNPATGTHWNIVANE